MFAGIDGTENFTVFGTDFTVSVNGCLDGCHGQMILTQKNDYNLKQSLDQKKFWHEFCSFPSIFKLWEILKENAKFIHYTVKYKLRVNFAYKASSFDLERYKYVGVVERWSIDENSLRIDVVWIGSIDENSFKKSDKKNANTTEYTVNVRTIIVTRLNVPCTYV